VRQRIAVILEKLVESPTFYRCSALVTELDPFPGNGDPGANRTISAFGEWLMRCFIRHPSDIPIHCCITRHGSSQWDRLKNISSGGLCFETQEALQQGCMIQITIPVRKPAFEATGTIVWCRRTNHYYDVGVQFTDESTEFAVRMIEQICQIHHYQREVLEKEGRSLSGADAATEWVAKYAQDFPS